MTREEAEGVLTAYCRGIEPICAEDEIVGAKAERMILAALESLELQEGVGDGKTDSDG
jgi:hypothetical protein